MHRHFSLNSLEFQLILSFKSDLEKYLSAYFKYQKNIFLGVPCICRVYVSVNISPNHKTFRPKFSKTLVLVKFRV